MGTKGTKQDMLDEVGRMWKRFRETNTLTDMIAYEKVELATYNAGASIMEVLRACEAVR